MRIALLLTTYITIMLVSACSAAEETRTVEWYKQNRAELANKLSECENNPGEKANTPNCVNAKAAAQQLAKFTFLVQDSLRIASGVKSVVTEYYVATGQWPANNQEAGLAKPELMSGEGFSSISVKDNTIEVRYKEPITSDMFNNTIILTAKASTSLVSWDCRGGTLPNEQRPDECKVLNKP